MSLLVIAFVVSLLVSCSLLMGAMLLIHRYEVPDNSRIILAVADFATAGLWAIWLVAHFLMPTMIEDFPVMSPFVLGYSLIYVSLVSLYSIEVKSPGRISNMKTVLVYLSPAIVLAFALLACVGRYHVVDYFFAIGRFMSYFDVWLRLVALVAVVVYPLTVLFFNANKYRTSATKGWKLRWFLLELLLVLLVVLMTVSREPLFEMVLYSYAVVFVGLLSYSELEVRIVVSAPPAHADRKTFEAHKEKLQEEEQQAEVEAAEVNAAELRNAQLWSRIQRVMEEEEVWRMPDLDVSSFSLMVLSNRTYVSQCLAEHYEGGFKEMINRYRVEAVKNKVDAGSQAPWNDLFFEVGFRSRSTAWRNFTQYVGVSPSEYRSN